MKIYGQWQGDVQPHPLLNTPQKSFFSLFRNREAILGFLGLIFGRRPQIGLIITENYSHYFPNSIIWSTEALLTEGFLCHFEVMFCHLPVLLLLHSHHVKLLFYDNLVMVPKIQYPAWKCLASICRKLLMTRALIEELKLAWIYLLKFATMIGIGKVMQRTPQIAQRDATNFPAEV